MVELPAELWNSIFNLASDEAAIFDHSLLTVMAESTWFMSLFKEWQLRTPEETLNLIQRRSYSTKKAIISTCKTWRRLGTEFLVRCLFFDDPTKLQILSAIFVREPNLGWWTRRIHITRYYPRENATMEDMANALVNIIRQCPNLEIFVVDWPMSTAFGPIADALRTYCAKSLRSVHWHVPCEALPKVIWALDSLRHLVSVHIDIEAPTSEILHLGSASDLQLDLKHLKQLSFRGFCQEFIEQVTGWNLPALRKVSFDFDASRDDLPDIMEFLRAHGTELTFLDLHCGSPLDTATILDICPFLKTFTFNLDWRLPTPDDDFTGDVAILANRPHENITEIGCHGLVYAFGVGYAAVYGDVDPLRTHLKRRTNERNVAALNKANFPNLKKVRVLSRALLRALEKSDGPEETCYERWEMWWSHFTELEEEAEDEDEDDGEENGEEEGSTEGEDEEVTEGSARLSGGTLSELRLLLDECRKMSERREESFIPQFEWH